jgi:hypothetical protein
MEANLSGADIASRMKQALISEPEAPTDEPQPEPVQAEAETSEDDTETVSERYKVKVNGEEKEVELDELLKGYMMESDYRKKTSELSEQRTKMQAKQDEIDASYEQAKTLLELETEDLNSPEMLELKEYDSDSYWKKFEKLQAKAKRIEELRQKRQAGLDEKKRAQIAKEQEKLYQLIPDWLDTGKRDTEVGEIGKLLSEIGYNSDEMATISDSRMFLLARKAYMYDQIQKQNISGKKDKTAPASVKAGTTRSKESVNSQKINDSRAKLKQSGHITDAQAAIKRILGV